MERYRILIWIGVIHHDTFRFPGDIKIEILKRRFYRFFKNIWGKTMISKMDIYSF